MGTYLINKTVCIESYIAPTHCLKREKNTELKEYFEEMGLKKHS